MEKLLVPPIHITLVFTSKYCANTTFALKLQEAVHSATCLPSNTKSVITIGKSVESQQIKFTQVLFSNNSYDSVWDKLRDIEIFESTNVLLMIYDSSDVASFQRLGFIHDIFKDSNSEIGAYEILVSNVSQDVKERKVIKHVKKPMVKRLMQEKVIPSYVELTICNSQEQINLDILTKHICAVINPLKPSQQPLFETVPLLAKKIASKRSSVSPRPDSCKINQDRFSRANS